MSDGSDDRTDGPANASEVWDRLQALPSMHEDPLVWDHRAGGFVRQSQASGNVSAAGAARIRSSNPPPSAPPAPVPVHAYPPPPPAVPQAPPPPPPPARPSSALDPTMIAPAPAPSAAGAPSSPRSNRRHVVINPTDAPPAGAPMPNPNRTGSRSQPPAPAPAGARRPPPVGAVPTAARPTPPRKPAKAPPSGRAVRPRSRGRTLKRIIAFVVIVPVLLLVLGFGFGWYKFSQIPRAEVSGVLSPAMASGTNYLIVGTDSREGITADDPNAGAFIGEKVTGARTDSIMVMHVGDGGQSLLSIPRDLWVTDPATGEKSRINATFGAGPANLIQVVQALGIPVQHYIEINFVSFGKLVDAVGGIDVTFEFPARDGNSGLDVPTAGVNHLDGTQGLAYVRSRHYEELKDGRWVEDPRSDLGRVARQRVFLTALMNAVTDTRNPFGLSSITDAMSVGLKIDDSLTLLDAIGLARQLRGFHPTTASLPVTPRTTSGGAAILELKQPDAQTVIDQFNAGTLVDPDAPPDPATTTTAPPPTTKRRK